MISKIISILKGLILSSVYFEHTELIFYYGRMRISKNKGKINIGHRTTIWPDVKLSVSGNNRYQATLKIGERCSIGDRTEIHCGKRISIGDDVIISWDCNILDRDYHSVDGGWEKTGEVTIGNRVWIGCRSMIMKNVKIGDDSVIAAGSIVLRDVPPNTLVAGIPAVPIRTVKGWRAVNNDIYDKEK